MRTRLLELLCCPECVGDLSLVRPTGSGDVVDEGTLRCRACGRSFPVRGGIPRFVGGDNYAASFGYQWNRFRREQLDPDNGTKLSERRLVAETGRPVSAFADLTVLDAGCGAGRFLEVASRTARLAVGMDFSEAVDAARDNLRDRRNVELVQADIYHLPFRPGSFDVCYSIGVVQHTPDPVLAVERLAATIRPKGTLALTAYERKPWTSLNAKYLVRPLTRRIRPTTLLRVLELVMPALFAITSVLFALPIIGRAIRWAVPVANYVENHELTSAQRYRWALMDTFDMLAPAYDRPQTYDDVRRALARGGIVEVRRLPNPGLNVIGTRSN